MISDVSHVGLGIDWVLFDYLKTVREPKRYLNQYLKAKGPNLWLPPLPSVYYL